MSERQDLPSGVQAFPGVGWPVASVASELGTIPVPVAERVAIPRTFHITINSDAPDLWTLQLMFLVDDGQVLFAAAMASGDPSAELHTILAKALAIQPLRWWQRLALEDARRDQQEADWESAYWSLIEHGAHEDDAADQVAGLLAEPSGPVPLGVRRNRITPALLAEVAEIYRKAHSDGAAPTRAVADHFGKKHSTAANWVVRARREGHLGPADGTRGGEQSS